MSQELTVVAVIEAKEGQEAALGEALQALVAPTVVEEGCQSYVLHKSRESAGTYTFIEKWDSEALLDQHLASPHLEEFLKKADDLVGSLAIHRLDPIS